MWLEKNECIRRHNIEQKLTFTFWEGFGDPRGSVVQKLGSTMQALTV